MAQCKQCGAQLADNAKFCTSCGTKVEAAPAAQPKPQQSPMQAQQQRPPQQMPPMQGGQPPMQGGQPQQRPPMMPPMQGNQPPIQGGQPQQGQQFSGQQQYGPQGQYQQTFQQSYQQNPNGQKQNVYPTMQVEQNSKIIAILMYIFPILFFIPLLQNPKEQFAMFHANQALLVGIASIMSYIIGLIPVLGWIIAFVVGIFIFVCKIMGIIAVVNNQLKPLPLIGKFQLIK